MKSLVTTAVLTSAIILTGCASSKAEVEPAPAKVAAEAPMMDCSMMTEMAAMHKDLEAMASDMDAMMKTTKDSAMKERMQKMHDQMAMMSSKMKMGGMRMTGGMGMMGGMGMGMMGEKPAHGESPQEVAPEAPASQDHKSHHPAQ